MVLTLAFVRGETHLQSPLATGADHLPDDVHERAGDEGGDREPHGAAVGERDDHEAAGDPPGAPHQRPGAGHDRVGPAREADLEQCDGCGVDDEQDGHHDGGRGRVGRHVEREPELHDEEVQREESGDDRDDDIGPVPDDREPRLAGDPRVRGKDRQPCRVPGGETGEERVEEKHGDVGPPLVDDERRAAEDRPEAERGVRDSPEVGLEEHAPPTRGELGDDALVDRACPALEEGEHAEQQREHPRRRGQDRRRAEDGRPDHERREHLPGASGVAEVTSGHLDDDPDHGRHRHGERHLRGAEADLAGEVERARRQDRPGAEAIGERPQREDAQVVVHRDAPAGQRWGRRRRRHGTLLVPQFS